MNSDRGLRVISRDTTITVQAKRESGSTLTVIDLSTSVIDVSTVDIDCDRTSEVPISIKQLIGRWILITKERIVRRNDHRRKREEAIRSRVDHIDRSRNRLSRRDELHLAIANGGLQTTGSCELFAKKLGVATLGQSLKTRCCTLTTVEQIKVSAVKTNPRLGEEERIITRLQILNRDLDRITSNWDVVN